MASRLAKIAGETDALRNLAHKDVTFLVEVCRAASKVRLAQKAYYKCKGLDPNEKKSLLIASKEAESELDRLFATQVDDGGQGAML